MKTKAYQLTKDECDFIASSFFICNGFLYRAVKCGGANAALESKKKYPQVKVMLRGKRRELLASRIIFFLENGFFPQEVDHEDGNPCNNAPNNLRAATAQKNLQNRSKMGLGKGIYPVGVFFLKFRNRYRASVMVGGKQKNKSFRVLSDAIAWRKFEAEKQYGEFAPHFRGV